MKRFVPRLLVALLLLCGTQQVLAQAVHATAGAEIKNTATVQYTVGTISQTAQQSNETTLVVDRLVNIAVSRTDTAAVAAIPDSNHAPDTTTTTALRFQVANNTNAAIGVTLVASNAASGTDDPFVSGGEVDSFDAGAGSGSIRLYLDAGTLGTFEPGTDTPITGGIASIPQETSVYVWVVGDIPAVSAGAPANNDLAVMTLAAEAVEPTTMAAITYLTAAQANTAGVDSVADATTGSDDSAYVIQSAQITVTKDSFVLADPITGTYLAGTRAPKAIPGATILYCIEVANDGSVAATDITINDGVQAGATYFDPDGAASTNGSIRIIANSATSTTCDAAAASAGTAVTDTVGDDAGEYDAGTKTVSTTVSSLPAGQKTTTVFQVTID